MTDKFEISKDISSLADSLHGFADQLAEHAYNLNLLQTGDAVAASGGYSFLSLFTAFILACFVGYFVVWRVTPALHSPLMGVTNAISSVIIVGALIAASPEGYSLAKIFGFVAVILASVNIFGGFVVTNRMLSMFKRKVK